MNGSLYLSPVDPDELPDLGSISESLCELQVSGPLLSEAPGKLVYAAGSGFPRHVIYAGCSPHLRFEPEGPHDRDFCHVALLGPYPKPGVITGENTVTPRCPACRKRLSSWQEHLHTGKLSCQSCGLVSDAWAVDWRQHAASGRLFIELRNVFPGEASPSDLFMSTLNEATGMPWAYSWAGMSPAP